MWHDAHHIALNRRMLYDYAKATQRKTVHYQIKWLRCLINDNLPKMLSIIAHYQFIQLKLLFFPLSSSTYTITVIECHCQYKHLV